MTPKFLNVLEMCIETGIEIGWSRAHKHVDTPEPHAVKHAIYDNIMRELYEWFDFDLNTTKSE